MCQEVERKLHDQAYEQKFLMSPSCIMLSKDFFLHLFIRERLPLKTASPAFRLPTPACKSNWSFRSSVETFFLLPQVPSSVRYLCRLLCRRRWKEERKRNILPIAFLIPTLLCFLPSPSSKGSFLPKCLAKQKRCCCFCMKNKSLIY